MNPPILLVDCNFLCNVLRFAYKEDKLSYDELETHILFGFFRYIRMVSKEFSTNKFVFCWDGRHSIRKTLFSEYKADRREGMTAHDEELMLKAFHQFEELFSWALPTIGFVNNFRYDGFEADDLIARYALQEDYRDRMVIISADSDLHQLLSDRITMYNPVKKTKFGLKEFHERYGEDMTPEEVAEVKAIAGDASDNIKGVPGVGEVTAIKYLKKRLGMHLQSWQMIAGNQELIKRNMVLVKLPLAHTPYEKIDFMKPLSLNGFIEVCEKYSFRSFLKGDALRDWKNLLGLQ